MTFTAIGGILILPNLVVGEKLGCWPPQGRLLVALFESGREIDRPRPGWYNWKFPTDVGLWRSWERA